jgi:hypothetical protein
LLPAVVAEVQLVPVVVAVIPMEPTVVQLIMVLEEHKQQVVQAATMEPLIHIEVQH